MHLKAGDPSLALAGYWTLLRGALPTAQRMLVQRKLLEAWLGHQRQACACSVYAVHVHMHMQCICSAHAHAVHMHMQCICTCSAHAYAHARAHAVCMHMHMHLQCVCSAHAHAVYSVHVHTSK